MKNEEKLLNLIKTIIKENREDFLKKEKVNLEEIIIKNFYEYGRAVILDRAIPNIYDGLKPVQRRILFSMYKVLKNNNSFKKSARIVGDVIGKYHPHGDSSVYEAIVSMIQPWIKRIPLIEGQGNFGSIDGDSPAAMRYTEIRLNKTAPLFFDYLDEEIIPFVENYDGTEKEPTVLPVMFPQLIINGIIQGSIGVGIASQMPPHNPIEVFSLINEIYKAKIKNKNITIRKFLSNLPGPDFPTGGKVIVNKDKWKKILETGKGTISLEGTYHIEKEKNRNIIVIDSIPYFQNKSKIVQTIVNLIDNKTIPEITNIKDESNNDDMRILIYFKTKVKDKKEIENIWNKLLKLTPLKINLSYNINVVDNDQILEIGLVDLFFKYADFQENIIKKKIEKDILNLEEQKKYLELILRIIDNIDIIINIIKKSSKKEIIVKKLSKLGYNEQEIQVIISMPLIKISNFEKNTVKNSIKEIKNKIKEKKTLLKNKELFYKHIININQQNLKKLKNFDLSRKTKIVKGE